MSTCKTCAAEIVWRPFNVDGSAHVCKKAERAQPACKYCAQPIAWKQENEHWHPMNLDGTVHSCLKTAVGSAP